MSLDQRRLWVRMELFEHFSLQLQQRCLAKLTPQHITVAITTLHQLDPQGAQGSRTPMTKRISYAMWKKVAEDIFLWKDNECRSFWLVLVFLHHQIQMPLEAKDPRDPNFLLDEDYFVKEAVPLFKLVVFLYIHTDKRHHRSKHVLEAVWRRDEKADPPALASPSLLPPGSPSSPHTVGLKDRSVSDTHHFNFVKTNLETIFVLLFDPTLTGASDVVVTPADVDLVGFLLCGGDSFLTQHHAFSRVYPKWSPDGRKPASKVCKWIRKYLSLNEALYPPIGFSLMPAMSLQVNMPVLQDMEVEQDGTDLVALPRPLVISAVSKTTVIKRAEEFAQGDLVIFACHDAYIYVLGPLRHVSIVASSNCKLVIAPNSGIFTVDRCEGMKISGVCALLRVNNCLDSVLNVFTPRRSIFTGDNRGLHIGPFNAMYPALAAHLRASEFLFVPQSAGQWNKFINLETDGGGDREEAVKDAVVLQTPQQFVEVVVPVKMDGSPSSHHLHVSAHHHNPFALPLEFVAVVQRVHENVESLRRLIASDEFDPPTKRALEQAIQSKFKEWLAASGNTRQVLDLVQLEKSRHSFSS
ncbi:Aste57867_20393 [Aphanomyces stellatus]|uniref:Aste57867_20393 protein n=1 Tax=Aphanomyces stellatus TaxID=120398 RepID=A0A485LGD4_9STRA|nr:hypothetical protein As57867_020327 [Aphanomyces stellatus]VFT97079.1 Aste57867_20393 [Aphanomyces stellatus]